MIVLHKFKDDTPKAPLTKPMFAKEVPQGKKDTKRQTSSRFNVSKNRELTRLPPLKDASVSFSILLSGLHSKNKNSIF